MTKMTMSRGLFYLASLLAGGLALAGLADFDPASGMLDIRPFDLREFSLTLLATIGNALAALAVWKGWGGR
ncbi:hypothetical protein Q9295_14775 [Xinfangfangia sp. CPCC 101601]|uniref:Uncharacterized protein n=1 Tax=Pseudogemmobacter lacusdianii TaxID=3069608 RepID=A0ABU0W0U3_9RHOB|nr:hypothetical protein [Xinfangfangia sp. CPCC 101601]MDQ2067639.1 hypothetical protein [Xinfangfangia sp. CPCC 101601]